MNRDATDALEGVGAKMRALRLRRNLSLRALARQVDVTPSLISQIETGKIRPSVASLYAIATALDVPLDFFFGEETLPPEELTRDSLPSMAQMVSDRERVKEIPPEELSAAEVGPIGQAVTRRSERERIDIDGFGGLVRWERLTSEHDLNVDFLEINYEPGASSARNFLRHSGREYGLVLEGELTIRLAFEEYVLGEGDSIAFDSSTPHRLSNLGNSPVRAVWIITNRRVAAGAGPAG